MARNLIRLSGFVPDEDIAIAFIGLRPGEKLYEELVGDGETVRRSRVDKVLRVTERALPSEEVLNTIATLERCAAQSDAAAVMGLLSMLLPGFSGGRPAALPNLTPHRIPLRAALSGRHTSVSRKSARQRALPLSDIAADAPTVTLERPELDAVDVAVRKSPNFRSRDAPYRQLDGGLSSCLPPDESKPFPRSRQRPARSRLPRVLACCAVAGARSPLAAVHPWASWPLAALCAVGRA